MMLVSLALVALSPARLSQDVAPAADDDARVVPLGLTTGPEAMYPDVVAGPDGSAWVSWIERRDEGVNALMVARFDGEELARPREVAQGADWFVNWADFPALAARDDGGVLASWLVRRGAQATHYDVLVALAPDAAAAFGDARRLHEDETEAEHGFVSLATLDAGRFGAVWLDGSKNIGGHGHSAPGAGATALRYGEVAADGVPCASVELDPRVCDCCQTAIVRRSSGELLVAYRGRSAEELRDIAFVRVQPGLEPTASEPRVVHADGWMIPGCPVNGPALAARGELVAASWFTLGAEYRARIQVAYLEAEAQEFSAPRRIDDGAPEGRVDLAYLGDELVASWLRREGDHAEWRVRVLPRDPQAPLPESLVVAEVPMNRSGGFLRMAPVGDALLAVWTDEGLHAALLRPDAGD